MPGSTVPQLTSAVQDYVKAIYALETEGVAATTTEVASRMAVSAPSATAMAKRMAELGLVARAPYRALTLTSRGRAVALEIVRHHRLIERFLVERLGYSLADVHAEAELLEHAISADVVRRLDAALGYPTHDPHGEPIPDESLRLADAAQRSLLDVQPAERAVIARVPDGDADLLRYLEELELVPGGDVEMLALAPFGGPATVRTRVGEHPLSRTLAAAIRVQ